MEVKIENKKIDKWNALVYYDEIENCYTITYDGKGGAIISDPVYSIAEKSFIEMMILGECVRKFNKFVKQGFW